MLKFKGYCAERRIKSKDIAKILGIDEKFANKKMNGKEPFTLEQLS